MAKDPIKQLDELVKKDLIEGDELNEFFAPYVEDTKAFIKQCLRKDQTRHMMLRTKWYTDIADGMENVKSRVPLKVAFLFSLAEGIAKERVKKANDDNNSKKYCLDFFKFISPDDKIKLHSGIRRSYLGPPHSSLRMSSIISLLYIVRSDAVHGRGFWDFSLAQTRDDKYTLMTHAKLGKPNRKRTVTLDVRMTYQGLRDIFIRTAIANIRSAL